MNRRRHDWSLGRLLWLAVVPCLFGRLLAADAVEPELPSLAREYLIRQWTSDDGLPQNSVIAMAQTTDGYLWLATFGGLARFDGMRFQVWDPDHEPALVGETFSRMVADRESRLWALGIGGRLIRSASRRFEVLGEAAGVPSDGLAGLAVGPDGTVWAGTQDGRLMRFDGRRFQVHAPAPEPGWGRLFQLDIDRVGRIWTEANGRRAVLEGGHWNAVILPDPGQAGAGLAAMPDGSVVLEGVPRGVQLLRSADGRIGRLDPMPKRRTRSSTFTADREGNLWTATPEEVLRRSADGSWGRLTKADGPGGFTLRSFLEDREGSLWFGTDGAGMFRVRRRGVRSVGMAEGMTRPAVLSVQGAADGSVLTAVHGGGVQRFRDGRFEPVLRGPELHARQLAWSLLPRADGGIWLGTWDQGFMEIPPGEAPAIVHRAETTAGLLDGPILALLRDSTGAVWIGGQNGLSRLSGGRFRLWSRTNSPAPGQVNAIAEAGAGAVWAGGDLGLARVGPADVQAITNSLGLAHSTVRALFAEPDGTVWLGGGGLTRMRNGRLATIRAADGLPAETVKSIIADDVGGLWLGTAHGIFRCARGELEDFCEDRRARINPTRFDRSDGMPSNECSGYQPAVWKGPDGRLWFATLNGLAIIDPGNLPKNPVPPPVAVETVRADGLVLEPVDGAVEIPPGTLLVEFQFTALSLAAPERNRFRCRLQDFDREPRETGTGRTAAYTRLPPGRYRFQVSACNNDGVWNDAGTAIGVVVRPFFWQTLPFRAASGTAALVVAGLAVRWLAQRRLRSRVAALEREQAIHAERARIARNMHDDVGASLTQIGLLGELARRQLRTPDVAEARLQELGDLSREVVRSLDALVWTVNPAHDTVSGLVDYLGGFAQEFLRPTGIACRFDLPATLPDNPVPAAARHHILLLFKEALNNLLKHSGATEVTFSAELSDGLLRLELRDNGRGFDPASAGRFNDGLANMRQRAKEAGGSCEIVGKPGEGTRVCLELRVVG